jgi:tRNA A58 N-methylase Trm61
MEGRVDYLTNAFKPDSRKAVEMANLQLGERVLNLGTGSRYVLAAAKLAVKHGLCVRINAVQDFLTINVLDTLARANLMVNLAGTDDTKVYLLNGNITDGALANTI